MSSPGKLKTCYTISAIMSIGFSRKEHKIFNEHIYFKHALFAFKMAYTLRSRLIMLLSFGITDKIPFDLTIVRLTRA